MSQYYNYNYNPNNQNRGRGPDWGSWIVTIIALVVFWPVGLVLLFRKLMGYSRRGPVVRHPYDLQSEAAWRAPGGVYAPPGSQAHPGAATQQGQSAPPPGAATQQGATQQGAPQQQGAGPAYYQYAPPAGKGVGKKQAKAARQAFNLAAAPHGKGLIIAGSILAGLFGFGALMFLAQLLSYGFWFEEFMGFLAMSGFACLGGVMAAVGMMRGKSAKRYRKYLSYIGKRQSLSISSLAQTMGISYRKVCDDLQRMLDLGILPAGYIDYQSGRLILSEEGIVDEAPAPKQETAEGKKPTSDDEILAEIRHINDLISDPDMSMKIDRIGEITGKILAYQRNNPTKAGQLRQFLNYYLPTTLKILRAYAQLEAQGVEGENITGAKARIEGMMDKVVEGFEKQLDRLFQNDAMDITTDVAVLERMIESDGLSSGDGMTLPI